MFDILVTYLIKYPIVNHVKSRNYIYDKYQLPTYLFYITIFILQVHFYLEYNIIYKMNKISVYKNDRNGFINKIIIILYR